MNKGKLIAGIIAILAPISVLMVIVSKVGDIPIGTVLVGGLVVILIAVSFVVGVYLLDSGMKNPATESK